MCADTCPNEQNIMAALRLQEPEKIPSFCQSIMRKVAQAYFEKYEDDLDDEDVLLTDVGDLTVYKAFGYSSRWNGAPGTTFIQDDEARDKIAEMDAAVKKRMGNRYAVTSMGAIRASNDVAGWFVEAGIRKEEDLRFFLDHWDFKEPTLGEIERFRRGRRQCMDQDFVPFASSNLIMEPANQSIHLSLTAKLMRKNPGLLEEFYDFLTRRTEAQFKAALKAGYKCFVTADDMAYKTGPMFSPENYRKFFVPCADRVCNIVHDGGGLIFMHTDGFIDSVMDCFIDAGYNAIQPLEPTSGMTIARVKRLWGDKLACIGNVDTTSTLSFGVPDDARKYVHRCFREAGGKQGETAKGIKGYIFAASGTLHDNVKVENALAMMDEYKKIRDGIIPI
ncbi:MAG: uroporphyrinogen decarboxylase family protein [Promethearchaeota archaeon]